MNPDEKRKVILFLAGQTASLFGSALVQYAISWHITITTKSGLMLTAATICGFLPQVLISLFAGVWADRFDRKKLIIFSDALIASSTVVLAILFTAGYEEIWLLFVISAIRSLGAGIQTPAVNAFLPDIVAKEHLMRVNGLNASIQGALMLVAPLAAGGLYEFMGLRTIFWVDVLTALVGISFLLMIRIERAAQPAQTAGEERHVIKEMLSGIRYVARTKWLAQFLVFYLIYALTFGPVMFLTPLMVARSFGDEAWRLVVHEVIFAVGMTAGGLAVGISAKKFKNTVFMVIAACVAFGVTTFVMGFSPNFIFYLGVMLVMGITIPFVNTGSMTVLQLRVQPDLMGRVFSLVSIVGSGTMPLSMAIFGPISDIVSIEALLIITGVLMVIIALAALRAKEMMAAGKETETEGAQSPRKSIFNEP